LQAGEKRWILFLIGLAFALIFTRWFTVGFYGEAMTNQPFFVPALLIGIAAIPLILGLVPRNRMYGFCTSRTLSDDSVWYRSNRFGGWGLVSPSGMVETPRLEAKFFLR
jgi:hypothetical protein